MPQFRITLQMVHKAICGDDKSPCSGYISGLLSRAVARGKLQQIQRFSAYCSKQQRIVILAVLLYKRVKRKDQLTLAVREHYERYGLCKVMFNLTGCIRPLPPRSTHARHKSIPVHSYTLSRACILPCFPLY